MAKSKLHTGSLHLIIDDKYKEKLIINGDGEIIFDEVNNTNSIVHFVIKEYQDEYLKLEKALNETNEEWRRKYIAYNSNESIKQNNANYKIFEQRTKQIEIQKKALKEQFSDVRYICCTVGNGLALTKDNYNVSYGKGLVHQTYQRNALERGGGKIYIEAFHENEDPQLRPPYGVYISAFGQTKILKAVWSDCEFKPITGSVQFGSTILLHIYTQDLYGQELTVELWDRDIFTSNDRLSTTDPNIEKQDSSTKGKRYYERTCEVNLYKVNPLLDSEQSFIYGNLADVTSKESNKYVQKAILQVDVGYHWIDEGGSDLKVYPTIKNASIPLTKNFSSRNYLNVNNKGIRYTTPPNRSVGLIGQVNTNVALFRPCGYYIVTAKEDTRENTLYNQYIGEITKNFELVAGNKLKEVMIKLDDKASTSDCMSFGLEEGESHTENVFSVSDNILPYVPTNTNEPKNIYAPAKEKTITKKSTEYKDVSLEMKLNGDSAETPHIVEKTDKAIIVGVNFNYDQSPFYNAFSAVGLPYVLRYFWFTDASTTNYDINIHSCRHPNHKFQLKVYPDIKWTLQLIFTNTSRKITVASPLEKKYREKLKPKKSSQGERKFELGLAAEYNNGDSFDLANEFMDTVKKMTEPLFEIVDFIEKTILGKNNTSNGEYQEPTEDHRAAAEAARRRAEQEQRMRTQSEIDKINKEENERIKELEKRKQHLDSLRAKANDPTLTDAQRKKAKEDISKELTRAANNNSKLLRKVVGIDIGWPEFNAGFSWKMAPVTNPQYKDLANTTELDLEGFIKFDPLIKADIFLDFLALAQKSHPIVLAIIAGLDIGLSLFGDGSRMVAELRLATEIGGEVSGSLNPKTKTAEDAENEDTEFAKIEGSAKLSIIIGVYLKMESRATYIWVGKAQYKLDVNLELKAEAKFSASSAIGTDSQGFYFSPILQFDGITIEGSITAKSTVEMASINRSASFEKKVVYQAIDSQPPKEYGKLYFRST